jgi:hypothetical protein
MYFSRQYRDERINWKISPKLNKYPGRSRRMNRNVRGVCQDTRLQFKIVFDFFYVRKFVLKLCSFWLR